MGARTFYGQWLKRTLWGSPSAADGYAGLIGTVAGIAVHYQPWLQPMVEAHLWQLPIWAFGAILVFRFFHAPYELWKEGHARILALSESAKIQAYALLITADTESDITDENKVTLNLRVKNTTPIALEVGGIIGYFRINAGEASPIKCSGYLLHVNGQCSYQFALGDALKEPRDGAIEMAIKLTYGLPGESPTRAVDQVMNISYQYRGALTLSRCSNPVCSETEI